MTRLVALAVGVAVITMVGAWYFFHEVFFIWIGLLLNLVKGVTVKSLVAWFVILFRRWLFVDVPKRIGIFFVMIGMPRRWRARLKMLRLQVTAELMRVQAWLRSRVGRVAGRYITVALALGASVIVFAVGVVYFGAYIVYFAGTLRTLAPIRWIGELFLRSMQNIAFRIFIYFNLFQLGRWIIRLLPSHLPSRLKRWWFGGKRLLLRRRRRMSRAVRERIDRVRNRPAGGGGTAGIGDA